MNTCNKCGRKSFATPCPDCGSDDYTDNNAIMFRNTVIAIVITAIGCIIYLLV